MKRTVTWSLMVAVLVGVMFVAAVPAVAQPAAQVEPEQAEEAGEDFERMAASQDLHEQMQMFIEMGMNEKEALFFSLMNSGKMDPATMMLLMAMMDGGGPPPAIGMMLLMNAMSGSKAAAQPVVLDQGETLLIIDGGVLYKVNLETMELAGSVPYARAAGADADALTSLLRMMMTHRVERERGAVEVAEEVAVDEDQDECIGNLRELCLAALIRAEDFEGKLPGETWVADIRDYHQNDQLLVCPSRPDLAVGYAMNRKLLGAKLGEVEEPAEVILFFEANLDGENPVGGPDDVPEQGVHNGGINCGFADGHCKWVTVETARDLLEQEPL